jgi:hypothetical protein
LRAATTLIGEPYDARPAVAVRPERLDRYAGTYRDSDGDDWVVTREGDHLLVTAGPRSWKAWPSTETEFFFRDAVRAIRFVSGPDGRIVGMDVDEFVGPVETARRIEAPPPKPEASPQSH